MRRIAQIGLLSLVIPIAIAGPVAADDDDDAKRKGNPVGEERYEDGGGAFVGYQVPIRTNNGRNRPGGGGGGPKYTCSFFIWESADGSDPAHRLIEGHLYELRWSSNSPKTPFCLKISRL